MKTFFLAAALCLVAATASAQITVKHAWIRATVPHQASTGAFMQLTAQSDSRLIAARSAAADQVEIHEMKMENHVMKMRPVESVALPAGKTVELKPGSYHIMLTGLKQQLKEGDSVPLALVIETAGKEQQSIDLQVPVHALTGGASHHHGAR